jgi:hypothetical protein
MAHPQSWQEYFKLSPEKLLPSASLIEAIAEGHISELDYLTWACENYEQPVLNISFFSSPLAPKQELWHKWRNAFAWSATCLPVGEWDGHLIIGSLEAVSLPSELSAISVFSPSSALRQLWNQWSQMNVLQSSAYKTVPEGEEIVLINSETNSEIKSGTDPGVSLESDSASESLMPEGLSETAAPPASFLSRIPVEPLVATVPLVERADVQIPKESAVLTPTIAAELQNNEEAPSPSEEPPDFRDSQIIVKSQTPPEKSWLELAQANGKDLFKKLSSELFAELKAYFDHTILLGYIETTKSVVALVWDVDLSEGSQKIYSLEAPSVLRIVRNTEKPYHGSPVINEFNEKFFEDWHSGELPDHLTITPLLVDGRIVGMVYASGRKAANTPQALLFAEMLTKEFLTQISKKIMNQAA